MANMSLIFDIRMFVTVEYSAEKCDTPDRFSNRCASSFFLAKKLVGKKSCHCTVNKQFDPIKKKEDNFLRVCCERQEGGWVLSAK